MTKTKTLTALAAAATLGLAAVAAPQPAEARGEDTVTGASPPALSAVSLPAPSSARRPQTARMYGYGPGYYAYVGPAYYGGCYWTRQRVWDGWGWRLRRVQVCG